MSRKWVITIVISSVVILLGVFVYLSGQDSGAEDSNQGKENSQKNRNEGPQNALTLKKDIAEQEQIQQNNVDKEEQDKKKDKPESDKKKPLNESKKKEIKKDLTSNSQYILTTINKPSSEQEKDSTQAKLRDVATNNFIDRYISNDDKNAKDKLVEFKNVKLTLDDENKLNDDDVEGTIVYDQIVKPKNGNDDVKPSVQVNSKMKLWFKKDEGKFKVDKLKI